MKTNHFSSSFLETDFIIHPQTASMPSPYHLHRIPLYSYQHAIFIFGSGYYEGIMDFPGGSDGKSICLQCGRPGFDPWVGKSPLEKEMATHSSILAWKIPWTDRGAWCATVHGIAKSDMSEQLHSHYEGGSIYFLLFYNIWFSFSFA